MRIDLLDMELEVADKLDDDGELEITVYDLNPITDESDMTIYLDTNQVRVLFKHLAKVLEGNK